MLEVIRKDLFDIKNKLDNGYYQIFKDKLVDPKFYLDNVIVQQEGTSLPLTPYNGAKYVIADSDLYNSVENGDIISSSNNKLRVILSRNANHNTLLVTERCNNLCQFCSQPPKKDDDSWLLEDAILAISAFNYDGIIGISGGEPLIYDDKFIDFIQIVKKNAPKTALHVLTNGRKFSDITFTKKLAEETEGMAISFGIPLYSTHEEIHDELVACKGAYKETIAGLINAGNLGINIELRIIPTKINYLYFYGIVELCARIFSNINQISIMNLEPTGWAKRNWKDLYISPDEYSEQLNLAINMTDISQIPLALFNYPLCHLPENLWEYSVQSISDWKNYYPSECSLCKMKGHCGGYFSSSYGKYHQAARAIL